MFGIFAWETNQMINQLSKQSLIHFFDDWLTEKSFKVNLYILLGTYIIFC